MSSMRRAALIFALTAGLALNAVAEDHSSEPVGGIGAMQQALETLGFNAPENAGVPEADVSVSVFGSQWKWSFRYDGKDGSVLELSEGEPLVVPVDQLVELNITSKDVIHEFRVPAFGLKVDAVPGMIQQTWFKAMKAGRYFGQCSALCGDGFAEMVVDIRVVSADEYKQWLGEQSP